MTGPMKTALALIAVMVFGLIALVIEVLRDTGRKWPAIIVAAVSVVVLAIALWIYPARAHDHDRPSLDGWFKSLRSKNTVPCCDGSDATRLNDVDWESKDGHYRVKLDGEWVDVPDGAVIEAPNIAGQAMVWPYFKDGALRGVRCFIPGSMI